MSEYQILHCICLIHLLEPVKTSYLVRIAQVFSGPSVHQAPHYEVQTWTFLPYKNTYTEGRAFPQQNVWCYWKIEIINWRLGVKAWTAVRHRCSQVARSWYTWKGLGKYLLNTESIKSSHLPNSSERSPCAGLLTQLLTFKSVLLWFLPGAKPNESLKERNCEVRCGLKWRLQEMGGKATKHSTSLCSPPPSHSLVSLVLSPSITL